ncbi:hypothetical protein L873DRAFT_1063294 [Choiromyces venosus 120613-1]|uniref:Uncharacterized protein n=1 Tax=Choiromyces venosus 120613-1 TaxID=1336337 RepID=A0A3N4JL49_9PEZI|nr:hypothetical protein L873DRAFT_1063294 [Choiromyces venosus 120613-1]
MVILLFPLRIKGRKHSEKIAFQPSAEANKKKKQTDLARRGKSNHLARFSIISLFFFFFFYCTSLFVSVSLLPYAVHETGAKHN